MTCDAYRDLAELLRDGAVPGPSAGEARSHAAGCARCRRWEEAALEAAGVLAGLPPGPFLPPPGAPWGGPPGGREGPSGNGRRGGGSRFLPGAGPGTLFLALLVLGGAAGVGAAAWAVRSGPGPGTPGPPPREEAPRREDGARHQGRGETAGESTPTPDPSASCVLFGLCVTAEGDRPAAGATVRAGEAGSAVTAEDGVFRIDGVPPGRAIELRIEAPGCAPRLARVPPLPPGIAAPLREVHLGPAVPVSVRVLDPRGAPAPGAEVLLYSDAKFQLHLLFGFPFPGSVPRDEEEPILRARADADGVARLGIAPRSDLLVLARGEGGVPSGRVFLGLQAVPVEVLVRLPPATVVEGRVTGPDGSPAAGVEVLAWRMVDRTPVGSSRTDAEGGFRLGPVPAETLLVAARRDGGPFAAVAPVDAEAWPHADLALAPEALVEGKVTDSASMRPLAGAEVCVRVSLGPLGRLARARTGDDGVFRVRAPVGAVVSLDSVRGPEAGAPVLPVPIGPGAIPAVTVPADREPLRFEVPVQRAARVEGRTLLAGGLPVPRTLVIAYGTDAVTGFVGVPVAAALSDARGGFALDGLPPGRVFLLATAATAVPRIGGPLSREFLVRCLVDRGDSPACLALAPGERGVLDLLLEPAATVSGRVLDPEGRPARAWIDVARESGALVTRHAWTDAEGRFTLRTVPPGKQVVLQAYADAGRGRSRPFEAKPGEEVAGIEVRLASPGDRVLRGRVLDADGSPCPVASVLAAPLGEYRPAPEWPPRPDTQAVAVDSEGRFRLLLRSSRDRWLLRATARGRLPAEQLVEVPEGGEVPEVVLSLAIGDSIEGRVLRADGSPAAGVPVAAASPGRAAGASPPPPVTASDGEGRFRIDGLPPGDLVLAFGPPGHPLLLLPGARAGGRAALRPPPGSPRPAGVGPAPGRASGVGLDRRVVRSRPARGRAPARDHDRRGRDVPVPGPPGRALPNPGLGAARGPARTGGDSGVARAVPNGDALGGGGPRSPPLARRGDPRRARRGRDPRDGDRRGRPPPHPRGRGPPVPVPGGRGGVGGRLLRRGGAVRPARTARRGVPDRSGGPAGPLVRAGRGARGRPRRRPPALARGTRPGLRAGPRGGRRGRGRGRGDRGALRPRGDPTRRAAAARRRRGRRAHSALARDDGTGRDLPLPRPAAGPLGGLRGDAGRGHRPRGGGAPLPLGGGSRATRRPARVDPPRPDRPRRRGGPVRRGPGLHAPPGGLPPPAVRGRAGAGARRGPRDPGPPAGHGRGHRRRPGRPPPPHRGRGAPGRRARCGTPLSPRRLF